MARTWPSLTTVTVALALFWFTPTTSGQCFVFDSEIPSSAPSRPIAIDGDVGVAGFAGLSALGYASVLTFESGTWSESATLVGSDIVGGEVFGNEVAVSGDVILVGASFGEAVYVFRYDGVDWIEEQKLVASDGDYGDAFGRALAIDGDLIVIGARGEGDPIADAGAAYVFRFDGVLWVEEQKLVASDPMATAIFGDAVDVQGDIVVVGASQWPNVNVQNGRAYVFRHDGTAWVEEAAFSAPLDDGWYGLQRFGSDVALEGDRLAIGSPGFDLPVPSGGMTSAGSVFVYEHDGVEWVFEHHLTIEDLESATSHGLGGSVDFLGDRIVAGAPSERMGPVSGAGAVYVFDYDGTQWSQSQRIADDPLVQSTRTGRDVATNGEWLLVARGSASYIYPSQVYRAEACVNPPFLRGDANGDGQVSGLPDAVHILRYQFLAGSPAPSCLDAADVDDDGAVNGLVDGSYLLAHYFLAGSPAPPAPGVTSCGTDPTFDSLDCDDHPCL